MTQRYQPEIDGLRALAIVLVVAFHAGLRLLPGGFVGVDVFFVLSGFLITRLLVDELNGNGRIDFVAFYARRVRRLLPALLTVVVAALAIGSVVLSASGERQELSRAALATATFTANFYFWRTQAVYFALRSDWLPLLNMWTLSVEEQFYALWPAILMLGAVFARHRKLPVHAVFAVLLVLAVVVSFGVFAWGAQAKPVAAFYATPARIWELALGGLLVLVPARSAWFARIAGPAGLALILIAAAAPGLSFAMRVALSAFGTAALIWSFSNAPKSVLVDIFKVRPAGMIGRLSYSWYLWHWPLLVFARIHDAGRTDHVRDGIAVFVALVLAALTYVLIENPIRRGRPWPFTLGRQTLVAGAALSLAAIAVSLLLQAQANAVLAGNPALQAIHAAANGKAHTPAGCDVTDRFFGLPPAQDCRIGAGPARLLLWGDSQAQQLAETLREDGVAHGYSAVTYTMSRCAPPPQSAGRPFADCADFNATVARQIPTLAKEGISGIVLASRTYDVPRRDATAEQRASWQKNLDDFLVQAERQGLRVLFLAPLPIFRQPWPRCLAHASAEQCSDTCAHFDAVSEPVVTALRAVVERHGNARLWAPWSIFCRSGVYLPLTDSAVFYSDSGHLSVQGARYLAPLARELLGWTIGERPLTGASSH